MNPQDFVGTWTLSVSAAPDCWNAFQVHFTIDQADADRAHKPEFINIVFNWWHPSTPNTRRMISGNVNWYRNDFVLVFDRNGIKARFAGTGSSAQRLEGTLTDDEGVFRTNWVYGRPCVASATAVHTSTQY